MDTRVSGCAVLAVLFLAGAARVGAGTLVAQPLFPAGSAMVLDGGDIEKAAGLAGRPRPLTMASLSLEVPQAPPADEPTPAPRPVAFEYSDGYRTRLKIHKYASYAMLPVFAAQYAVGQKLYDGEASDSTRSWHGALAATTAALFTVNSVTGVWNLAEARKDPNHRAKRTIHGVLMLLADAGFVATGAMAPESEHEGEGGGSSPSAHRTVALASMGVATAAYLMMLIH